ncbi:hypothetical protein N0V90_005270 [Kalmusia sp. IMI 367209]|nr:hypothetical protein N0V90_005270 [Kalmusia sp. IMI 367209]
MPLYDIEHVIPLTEAQQEKLAKAFTSLHSKRFQTPSFFVNVRFTDASSQKVYRGGVLRSYNRAVLRTRASDKRSTEEYGQHCRDLISAWTEIVSGGSAQDEQAVPEIETLRSVWVMGALTTAVEMGIQRPAVGQEIEWLRENKSEFERLAGQGDEDMQQLIWELENREDFIGVFGAK